MFGKLINSVINQTNDLLKQTDLGLPNIPPIPTSAPHTPSIPAVPVQSSQKLYSDRLEHLIDMAVLDGKLTEHEMKVLLSSAEDEGEDVDEFAMVVDARLYARQQQLKAAEARTTAQAAPPMPAAAAQPRQRKEVNKCPSCGKILPEGSVFCSDCGYEFIAGTTPIMELARQLAAIDSQGDQGGTLSKMFAVAFVDKLAKKKSLIEHFPVPCTRDCMIEFITYAAPKAKKISFFSTDEEHKQLQPVWHRKCQEMIGRARIKLRNDHEVMRICEETAKELKIKI